jgi:hypothetical protein
MKQRHQAELHMEQHDEKPSAPKPSDTQGNEIHHQKTYNSQSLTIMARKSNQKESIKTQIGDEKDKSQAA